jgi:aryl-alcohol dehydrogenase-like predicted oxidoreductase
MEAYDRRGTDRTWAVIDAVQKVAGERGVSMAEVALAWVTGRPAVTGHRAAFPHPARRPLSTAARSRGGC